MKRILCLAAALCLLLCGCSGAAPARAVDGTAWEESWITLGNVLGVEEPGNGLVLRDNNEALSASDMYLASWTIGEAEPYVNEDGDEVALYPARLDALLYGRRDSDAAARVLEDWTARLAETYRVESSGEQTVNGQAYRITSYLCTSEENPYGRGIAAFGAAGSYAVSIELNCLEDFPGDEAAILAGFLESCHYAASN